jgi:chemotaxis protein MotA
MKSSRRVDYSTVCGVAVALTGILLGLKFTGLCVADLVQITAALIVLGGTLGAVLMSLPLAQVRTALRTIPTMFVDPPHGTAGVVELLMRYSRTARLKSLAALEPEMKSIEDPFFRRAMSLAVDSVDSGAVRSILELELSVMRERLDNPAVFFETAAGYAPTLGIAAAAIGLIQVMRHLDHLDLVGAGVAAAFVSTIYGILLANVVLLPIATKIRARGAEQLGTYRLILEGIVAIVDGENPTLLRSRLDVFLQSDGTVEKGQSLAPIYAQAR